MGNLENQAENEAFNLVEDTSIPLPPEKKVVFYNDDFTTMEFVIDVLISVFNKTKQDAENIMMQIHTEGSGLAGVYTYDIAVSRANLAKQIARNNGFPLRVEVE